MEKGLNSRNSLTKNTKVYKKTHASKSSLDETALKIFQACHSPPHTNPRGSLQHSPMRNTFNAFKSPTKSREFEFIKTKVKKVSTNNKKVGQKVMLNVNKRHSAAYFTSTVTPSNKSKCGSMEKIAKLETHNQIQKFKFIYQIGFGGFGKVWKVLKRKTCKQYAMKEINKKRVIQKDNVESIMNQRYILSSLHHPFLINMHSSFQDEQNLYLTMDYLRGADLRYHICYKERFTEAQIKFVIACLIVGLEYVHEKGIIHRDVKPENIVFEETGYARLTDFGIAKVQASSNLPLRFQTSGTPGYMAPEILCKMPYTFSSDFFAIGVIVYELMFGNRPYDGNNRQQIRQNILMHQASVSEEQLPKGFSKSMISFVNGLLQRNPEERLGHNGFKEIKCHKWLKDIKWKALQRKEIVPPFKPHVICQTKEYLDQIILYNQMRTNDQNSQREITKNEQLKFADYDFKKVQRLKIKTQKHKDAAQNSIAVSKSKAILSKTTSQFNIQNLSVKNHNTTNNFLKKNKRQSQQKVFY